MGRKDERDQGLANASVNTSVRGGSHDGETSRDRPANLGLPADDQQAGMEATEGQPASAPDRNTRKQD